MKRITVTQVLTISQGVIALTEDQYKRRQRNLTLIGDDNFDTLELGEDDIAMLYDAECAPCRIVNPVMFKVGETLFLDELPKSMNPSFKTDADLEEDALEAEAALEKVEAARLAAEADEADSKTKEANMKSEWEASDALRSKFDNDFELYLASEAGDGGGDDNGSGDKNPEAGDGAGNEAAASDSGAGDNPAAGAGGDNPNSGKAVGKVKRKAAKKKKGRKSK